MNHEKPETLLKSALEKILYFEARSSQLTNDADTTRSELERFKADLAAASQREIELRRVVAELEVRVTRAHSEREETARVADALRRERAELIGKMLEASRIHGLDRGLDDFDLGQFIAQLRSEVLVQREGGAPLLVGTPETAASDTVAAVAGEFKAQGRLNVTATDFATLTGGREFPGRSEETLFGFSVRELSAPDVSARVRAAQRLQALRHQAASPALATALHSESEPSVQVALLAALSSLAQAEALPVVTPLLSAVSPEVRIAALKAMLTLDAPAAAPHLAAATKDPDKAVRRRASLLALGLSGKEALELGTQAIRDTDADVRALAALVLGASNAEVARPLLLDAMRDVDLRVRRAASQSLSRLLGQDVTSLVGLDDAHRRREVRRLANVPSRPISALPLPKERVEAQARAKVASEASGRQSVCANVMTEAPVLRAARAAGVSEASLPTARAKPVAEAPALQPSHAEMNGARATGVSEAPGVPTARAKTAAKARALPPSGAELGVSEAFGLQSAREKTLTEASAQQSSHVAARAAGVSEASGLPTARAKALAEAPALSPSHTEITAARAQTVAPPPALTGHHRTAPQAGRAPDAPAFQPAHTRSMTEVAPVHAKTTTAVIEALAPERSSEELEELIITELRAAMRGRPLNDLAEDLGVSSVEVMRVCGELMARGQVVRRGLKYFVA